jgi:Domain of unknown function (DUF5666)
VLPVTALGDNGAPTANAKGNGWFAGAVTSASSGSVSLDVLWTGPHDTQLSGTSVSVGITPSTNVVYGKGQSSIAQGDLVRVRAGGIGTSTLTARRIHVDCDCHYVGGTLDGVSNGALRISVARTGPYDTVLKGQTVTIHVADSTQYIQGRDKKQITLNDLGVGDRVGVIFAATGFFKDPSFDWQNATFTAKRVHDFPKKS